MKEILLNRRTPNGRRLRIVQISVQTGKDVGDKPSENLLLPVADKNMSTVELFNKVDREKEKNFSNQPLTWQDVRDLLT